jgi:methionyl-tRNA formyltransferase
LPKYRGAAPIQRAIWAGETSTGVSLMWMVRAMDAGDVIARVEEPITEEDTAGALTTRLATRAASLLLAWLPTLDAGQAPHYPQDPAAVLFAPPLRKEECIIDWTQSAETIRRQVQALAPSPGAVTRFRGQPVKIFSATLAEQKFWEKEGEPGAIIEINPKNGLVVATGAGVLKILSLQPAGKRAMSGADFLRGYHVAISEQFRPDQS